MKRECLEIIRLGDDGSLKHSFRCLPGRLTVLRASDHILLCDYSNAFAGKLTKERFRILYGGKLWDPSVHVLIGFYDESFDESDTVAKCLSKNGASGEAVKEILEHYELSRLSELPLSELSHSETQAVRLMAAAVSDKSVVVLTEPFDPLSPELREPFAKLLLDLAWEKQSIVLITKLSHRPQCWVNNEVLCRIQVDAMMGCETIGVGAVLPKDIPIPGMSKAETKASAPKLALLRHGLAAFSLICAVVLILMLGTRSPLSVTKASEQTQSAMLTPTSVAVPEKPAMFSPPQEQVVEPVPAERIVEREQKAEEERSKTVLAAYPEDVQAAVLNSYRSTIKAVPLGPPVSRTRKSTKTARVQESDDSETEPETDYSDEEESEFESGGPVDRQNKLREQFLQALRRAAQ